MLSYIVLGVALFSALAFVLWTVTSTQFQGSLQIAQGAIVDNMVNANAGIQRTKLGKDSLMLHTVKLTDFKKTSDLTVNLPNAASGGDLGLISGTFASASPSIESGDLHNAGSTTRTARVLIQMPAEFPAFQNVKIRCHAGMVTTVASTAATLQVAAYRSDTYAGISANLQAGGAQSINNLAAADYDFTLDGTQLSPGDWIDVQISVLVNDTGTGTVVKARVGDVRLLCDMQG